MESAQELDNEISLEKLESKLKPKSGETTLEHSLKFIK
jgi:hypothetical protein